MIETESSLDAGSRIVGFCPHCFRPGWLATAVRRAGRHLARPSFPKYQGIHRPPALRCPAAESREVGEVIRVSAAEAAKFQPIYNEYDAD